MKESEENTKDIKISIIKISILPQFTETMKFLLKYH
jgi:hypothetical protein